MEQNKEKDIYNKYKNTMMSRYKSDGLTSFEPQEILEMLLLYAAPRKDIQAISRELLDACGSVSSALDAPIEILMRHGLSFNAAVLLHMIPDISRAYQSDKFCKNTKNISSKNIGEKAVKIFSGMNKEMVYAFFFDAKGKEKYSCVISKGDVSGAPIFTKEIIGISTRRKAASVIISHNHPSGIPYPSKADLEATEDLAAALRTVNVKLIDHIIIADNDYISLASISSFSYLFKDSHYN